MSSFFTGECNSPRNAIQLRRPKLVADLVASRLLAPGGDARRAGAPGVVDRISAVLGDR